MALYAPMQPIIIRECYLPLPYGRGTLFVKISAPLPDECIACEQGPSSTQITISLLGTTRCAKPCDPSVLHCCCHRAVRQPGYVDLSTRFWTFCRANAQKCKRQGSHDVGYQVTAALPCLTDPEVMPVAQGAIAGGVVAAILFILALVIMFLIFRRRRRNRAAVAQYNRAELGCPKGCQVRSSLCATAGAQSVISCAS